jgi:hypothetical protein
LKEIIKDMQTGDANIAAFNTLIFRKETHSWASTMAPPARSADQLHAAAILGHHGWLGSQERQRGLSNAGIKFICTGDVIDDDQLNGMGDAVIGTISAGPYTAAHPSEENERFVTPSRRPMAGCGRISWRWAGRDKHCACRARARERVVPISELVFGTLK